MYQLLVISIFAFRQHEVSLVVCLVQLVIWQSKMQLMSNVKVRVSFIHTRLVLYAFLDCKFEIMKLERTLL